MSIYEVLFLAFALAIDATLVCFSFGLNRVCNVRKEGVALAFGVSFFQFLLPFFGYYFANIIYKYIESYANIIAGTIFIILGLKFLKDSFSINENEKCEQKPLSFLSWLIISVSVSIDALFAGCSMYFLNQNVQLLAISTGVITFSLSILALYVARKVRNLSLKFFEILGAIILIGIGIKTILNWTI